MPNVPDTQRRTEDEGPETIAAAPAPSGALPPTPEPTLGQLVSTLTGRAPDWALAFLVVVGILGVGVVVLIVPSWWRALPVFALLSAVGAWGIADRERHTRGLRGGVFAAVRAAAMLGSVVAAATLFLLFMRVALGNWIS